MKSPKKNFANNKVKFIKVLNILLLKNYSENKDKKEKR